MKDLNDVRDEIAQRLRVTKERSVYYDLLFRLQHSENVFIFVPPVNDSTKSMDSTSAK